MHIILNNRDALIEADTEHAWSVLDRTRLSSWWNKISVTGPISEDRALTIMLLFI
jgi:hypothetical protein